MNISNKDSIHISDSKLEKTKITNITQEKRKSFWKGFVLGVISSVIGGGVWYLIETYLINK